MYCYQVVATGATQQLRVPGDFCVRSPSVHGILTLSHSALRHHPDKGGDPELFKEMTHA